MLGASADYPVGSTGGEVTHTLTETELPVIKPPLVALGTLRLFAPFPGETGEANTAWVLPIDESKLTTSQYTYYVEFGGNEPHNNMQPYYATNIWKKVAD